MNYAVQELQMMVDSLSARLNKMEGELIGMISIMQQTQANTQETLLNLETRIANLETQMNLLRIHIRYEES